MSVHGYPVDKSIFYCNLNLKLGLLTVTRRDSWHIQCRHRSRRCLSCWRAVCYCFTSVFVRRCWATIRGLLSRRPWARTCGRNFGASSNRLLGSMLVIFLRGRLRPVGACAFHIQPAKQTLQVASHLLSFYQLQKVSCSPAMCDKMVGLAL